MDKVGWQCKIGQNR